MPEEKVKDKYVFGKIWKGQKTLADILMNVICKDIHAGSNAFEYGFGRKKNKNQNNMIKSRAKKLTLKIRADFFFSLLL